MSTTGPVKPAPVAKYEAFVDKQLTRARQRIRLLDTAAALLGLLTAALAYGLVMTILDAWLHLAPLVRQIAFGVFSAAAASYLGLVAALLLFRRVNPYYAARQMEQAVSGAKNSIVNWLDLRAQKLPPAIRGAVSHRAAKDLGRTDLDQAISARRTGWLAGITVGLFVALVVLFLWVGPHQFYSLLAHAFKPFVEVPLATRTSLTLVQPEGGNATVAVGRAVSFAALVDGKVPDPNQPDAARLRYRYHPNESYEELALEKDPATGQWVTQLPAYQVHNGFWYKLSAGDAETPEYRVQVRSTPLLADFDVSYHYRPYLRCPDQTTHDPNLEAMRGTEVTLLARTNRTVKKGSLEVIGDKTMLPAELVPEDPQALRFRLVLDKGGSYRIWFTSVEGEGNTDPMPYQIKVLGDQAPVVQLTQPGQDIYLPANGLLQLAGSATDDLGLTRLVLQMKVNGEQPLQSKPYGDEKTYRLLDGSYCRQIDYQDFVDLAKVKLQNGTSLRKGMVIEYWLEATDNCDFPAANVGRSEPTFKVVIADPEKDQARQQQQRQQAQQQKQKHDVEQARKQAEQNRQRQGQASAQPDKGQQGGAQKTAAEKNGAESKQGQSEGDQQFQKDAQRVADALKQSGNPDPRPNGEKGGHENNAQAGEGGKSEATKPTGDKGQTKPDNTGQPQPSGQSPGEKTAKPDQQQGGAGASSGGDKKGSGNPGESNAQKNSGTGSNDHQGETSKPQPGTAAQQNDTKAESGANHPSGGQNSKPDKQQPQKNGTSGSASDKKDPGTGGKSGAPDTKAANPQGGDRSGSQPQPEQGGNQGAGENQPGHKADKPKEPKGSDGGSGQQPNGSGGQTGGSKSGQSGQKAEGGSANTQGSSGDQAHPEQGAGNGDQRPGGQAGSDSQGQSGDSKTGSEKGSSGQAGDKNSAGQAADSKGQNAPHGDKSQAPNGKDNSGQTAESGQKPGSDNGSKGGPQDNRLSKSIGDLAKALQSQDPQARQEAAQKLEQIRRESRNPETRQAAADALKQAGRDNGSGDKQQPPAGSGEKSGTDSGTRTGPQDNNVGKMIEDLAKQLQSQDAKVRDEAARKLEQIRRENQDADARQAAEDALKNGGQGQDTKNGKKPGDGQGTQEGSEGSGDSKGNPQDQKLGKALADLTKQLQSKDSQTRADAAQKLEQLRRESKDPATRQAAADALQKAAQGQPNSRDNGAGQGSQSAKTETAGPKTPGAAQGSGNNPNKPPEQQQKTTTGGDPGNGHRQGPAGDAREERAASAPDLNSQRKAGDLQLERLPKKLPPEVLKKLDWTDADYQRFLQEVARRRQQAAAGDAERLADPKRGGGLLPNQGPRQVKGTGDQQDPLQYGGPALPPPGFRDAQKEFTEKLSQQQTGPTGR